jgi:hypothetical protein
LYLAQSTHQPHVRSIVAAYTGRRISTRSLISSSGSSTDTCINIQKNLSSPISGDKIEEDDRNAARRTKSRQATASGVLAYAAEKSPGRRSPTDASWRGAVMRGMSFYPGRRQATSIRKEKSLSRRQRSDGAGVLVSVPRSFQDGCESCVAPWVSLLLFFFCHRVFVRCFFSRRDDVPRTNRLQFNS